MAEILLVHGSCHGAWCWRDLLPELAALGHTARALDLPGHGKDTTPLTKVTLDLYAKAILNALSGPTLVLGHSMAGFPISRAADLDPALIKKLVYLCAYVPLADHSLVDMRRRAKRQPLMDAFVRAPDGRSYTFDPAKTTEKFYLDCSDEQRAFANAHLGPQPVLPQATKVTLGPAYAQVPRFYIRCLQDGAVPTEFQAEMARDFAPENVFELDTSHSPFFSAPRDLAVLIDRIADL